MAFLSFWTSRISCAKRTPALLVWNKARLAVSAFFFSQVGDESNSDHLVEVVRRDAAAASWFIQMTIGFGIVGGVSVCTACVLFLSRHWESCSICNRPLRLWLVGQCLLQVIQLPVRTVLWASIRATERAGGSLEACVSSITMAPAWHVSKTVALVHYSWFVLGVVWWVNSNTCNNTCPGIYVLLMAVLLLFVVRAALALVLFQLIFGHRAEQMQASQVEPATDGQIVALPVVNIRADSTLPAVGTTCAVCLCDFEEGESAKKLPCGHHFHKCCIDRWLQRSKRCPLCMHPIDELVRRNSRLRAKIW